MKCEKFWNMRFITINYGVFSFTTNIFKLDNILYSKQNFYGKTESPTEVFAPSLTIFNPLNNYSFQLFSHK